jgi:ATP-dependent Clp protease adaptor protein ClpS
MGQPYSPDAEEEVTSGVKEDIKEPSMYKVLLHNDDYTTMEFVVEVLMFVFNKSPEEATMIMLNVHEKGIGVCGVYTYEVAETKVDMVHTAAREHGFPLKCSMEEE